MRPNAKKWILHSAPPMMPMMPIASKVGLGMPRRMNQRHEHLLSPLPPAGHVILHDRDAAGEAVLIPQRSNIRFEVCCCFCGRPLSSARILSMIAMNGSNFGLPAASTAGSQAAPRIPASCRRFLGRSHTAAPPPACLSPRSELHAVPLRRVPRPSSLALCRTKQRASTCRIFTPAQPTHSVASSEGFLLRRLHASSRPAKSSFQAPSPANEAPKSASAFTSTTAKAHRK
jgi:hypothetical protein